jgi:hypothetical protein
MDEKIRNEIQSRVYELYLVRKYWPSLIREAFLSALLSWVNVFVIGLLATIYALFITLYRNEFTNLNDFFPPHFGEGLLLAFATVFLYKLVVAISQKVATHETEAWKYTWNDIEVTPFFFPSTFGNAVGLEIISDKNRNVYGGTSREFSINVTKLLIEEFTQVIDIKHPRKALYMFATDLVRFPETTTIQNRRDTKIKDNWIKHVVVLVAQWDENGAWIVTKDGVKDLLLEQGKPYGVIVDFNEWSLEDNTMKWGCAVWCNLRHIKSKEGSTVVEIEISKRNPPYAYESQRKKLS